MNERERSVVREGDGWLGLMKKTKIGRFGEEDDDRCWGFVSFLIDYYFI